MINRQQPETTTLRANRSYQGETLEQKIRRIVSNKEPIKDGAPLIYTERKHGVQPEYDIRTDRWEVAVDAMSHVNKSHIAKRDHRMGEEAKKNMEKEQKTETTTDTGGESTQATETK